MQLLPGSCDYSRFQESTEIMRLKFDYVEDGRNNLRKTISGVADGILGKKVIECPIIIYT